MWEWVGYGGLFAGAVLALILYVAMVIDRKD